VKMMPKLVSEEIAKYDASGMLDRILHLPSQIEHAVTIARGTSFKLADNFSNICLAGMGGSAIGGYIARACFSDIITIPFAVNRFYSFPKYVNENSLVIACSYSGDTEETLSAYDDARAKGARIVCVTAGGILAERARRDGYSAIVLPGGYPPRSALGYLTVALLYILFFARLIADPETDMRETIAVLRKLAEEYHPGVVSNRAKEIAYLLHGKIPLIYTSAGNFEPVALRWKCQLEENSEMLGFSNVFPELNHNEIMGWGPLAEVNRVFQPVYLRDPQMHPAVLKRMQVTKTILERHSDEVIEVASTGSSLLARMFSLIFLGDMVSLYLAILNRVDPTAIANIDFIKKSL